MTLLVSTLKRRKKNIPNFTWKSTLALVGNNYILQVGNRALIENGWSYDTYILILEMYIE